MLDVQNIPVLSFGTAPLNGGIYFAKFVQVSKTSRCTFPTRRTHDVETKDRDEIYFENFVKVQKDPGSAFGIAK